MTEQAKTTYTVHKGTNRGEHIEMDIPVDAVKSPRETEAAFHRRVAVAVRVTKPECRTSSACCCRGPRSTSSSF